MDDHDDESDDGGVCPECGIQVADDDLSCSACGEPLDDPARGICGFCGVATVERCGGCNALICWECSDGAREGENAVFAGVPWCVDCRSGAAL